MARRARRPYAGFILESTAGVSSAAKSNSFSINQSLTLDLPIETKLDFQGEVKLPGTKYDPVSNNIGLTVRLACRLLLPLLQGLHWRLTASSCVNVRGCIDRAPWT